MKHTVKILTTCSAMAMIMASSAFAADLTVAEPINTPVYETPTYQAPEHVPANVSGWYIRGDASYNWNKVGDIDYVTYGTAGGSGTLTGELKESFSIGAGIGYQITDYLRTDVTADYQFETDFSGSSTGVCQTTAAPTVDVECVSTDSDSYTAWTVLANAYLDLGTYNGFTPYVGAGIGGAHVTWGTLSNTIDDQFVQGGTTTHEGASDWRFAYALMIGASYDVSSKVAVDVGYRLKKIEGGDMFQFADGTGPGYDSGLTSHEVRAGLRYKFGCGDCGGNKKKRHHAAMYK